VIDLVDLAAKRDTRVLKLSGGQQRRLDVAIALAGDPDLLFLDEPTTGFDPSARREAWEVIKNLAVLGKTVLLTTHYMEEAQYLADHVAVISSGRIVAEGPPATIGNRELARARIRYRLADGATPPVELTAPPGPDGLIELVPDDLTATLHRLTGWAMEQHVELTGLEVTRPTLEDVYLQLTDSPSAQASAEPAVAAGGRRGWRRS
jgi:ABC-2 type transport system ATP-binding protein